jgi:hypothetical protein
MDRRNQCKSKRSPFKTCLAEFVLLFGGGPAIFKTEIHSVSAVNAEKTYLVRQKGTEERLYRLYELTFLWRHAQLSPDAVYRDDRGEWRSVDELVAPALAVETAPPKQTHSISARMEWTLTIGAVLLVAGLAARPISHRYANWKTARLEAKAAEARAHPALKDDFIANDLVVPGMTREDVRRIIGPGRSIQATGDGRLERWIYRTQIIVFEDGKVIGTEDVKK